MLLDGMDEEVRKFYENFDAPAATTIGKISLV